MKIDNNPAINVFLRPQENSVTHAPLKTGSAEDFAALVEKAKGSAPLSVPGADLYSTAGAEKGSASAFLAQDSLAQLRLSQLRTQGAAERTSSAEASQKIDETLKLLEDYAIALGDPSMTLKDIAPMAEELSLSSDVLSAMSLGIGAESPLKGLSDETSTLAAVEALKFKRGDFI
ncbi:MAG: hypothetical protein LBO66_11210 [Deltaproteobacteria bacterium]|jgi:hypothetical protein|nr:hypothetical protein [Deltaproteobacteria bacterium]